jgi:hypothetical protein
MFMRTEFRAKTACNGARGLFVLLLGFGLSVPVGVRAEDAAAAQVVPIAPESAPDVGSTHPETSPAPADNGREPTDPAEGGTSVDLQFEDAPVTELQPAPEADAAPATADTPLPADSLPPRVTSDEVPPVVDFTEPPREAPGPVPAPGAEAVPGDAPQVPGPPTRRQLCAKPDDRGETVVDGMQVTMEETTCAAALWLDGLFGEPRNLDTARKTSGFLESSVNWSEFKDWDQRTRFRVRFKVPNLKNRVSAVFGRDNENDVVRDRAEGFAVRSALPQIAEDDSWLAGLGYSFPGSERFKTDFRVGAAGAAHPRVYVQQRARYIAYADDEDLFYLRGTGFWTSRQGFGVTAGIDYSHVLTKTLLLRVTDVGTVSEKTVGLDWFSGIILYHNLREERAMAYELLIRGQTDEPEPLYEYGGRVVYRHPFMPKRLYVEFLVGYSWPRDDPAEKREGSAQAGISLEIPFGQRDDD